VVKHRGIGKTLIDKFLKGGKITYIRVPIITRVALAWRDIVILLITKFAPDYCIPMSGQIYTH